jgi:capsule biosynthesis phosphatase
LSTNKQRVLVVDLDGTLCEQTDGGDLYTTAKSCPSVIEVVNVLHEVDGWRVIIFTARGMNTFNGDGAECDRQLRVMTEKWLSDHGVKYDELVFGKPAADLYVDDKMLSISDFTWEYGNR